jgi:hypothetical protein
MSPLFFPESLNKPAEAPSSSAMGAWRMVRLARNEAAMKPVGIYGVVVGLAMVPGAVFFLLPPILVAFTGLVFLFILWVPTRVIDRERVLLAVET